LRFSFAISLCVHALALGIWGLSGVLRQPAKFKTGEENPSAQEIEIIAPMDVVAAPAKREAVPAVTSIQPKPAEPVEVIPQVPLPATELLPQPVVRKQQTPVSSPEVTSAAATPTSKPDEHAVVLVNTTSSQDLKREKNDLPQPDENIAPSRPNVTSARVRADYHDNPELAYPAQALRRHEEGLVLLDVYLSNTGHPKRIEVKGSSGFPVLDNAAIDAVNHWGFDPARIGTVPVDSQIEVPIRFKIQR
jgi:periplasmic protein TonB